MLTNPFEGCKILGPYKDQFGRKFLTITKPDQIKSKRVYYYRYLLALHLGRELESNEIVHHINGDFTDDRLENFELTTKAGHQTLHAKYQPIEEICRNCMKTFVMNGLQQSWRKSHLFDNPNAPGPFCSPSCVVSYRNKNVKPQLR